MKWLIAIVVLVASVGQVQAGFLSGTGIINGNWSLMTIDRSNGSPTQVGVLGTSGVTVDGLAETPNPTTVHEPSSLTLLASGAIGLFGYGWRRKRKSV